MKRIDIATTYLMRYERLPNESYRSLAIRVGNNGIWQFANSGINGIMQHKTMWHSLPSHDIIGTIKPL